ncbi:hypothetical protein FHG87_001771 [Trinorchestia longiramus]|nr:hypothetical protein FHG87_001771 [Trinorchestia longiramus]
MRARSHQSSSWSSHYQLWGINRVPVENSQSGMDFIFNRKEKEEEKEEGEKKEGGGKDEDIKKKEEEDEGEKEEEDEDKEEKQEENKEQEENVDEELHILLKSRSTQTSIWSYLTSTYNPGWMMSLSYFE